MRAVILYAAVLGLNGADAGAIGAMAGPLQQGLGIGKTQLGLLLTASLGTGAVATLPFGWLVDRVNRVRLLTWVVAVWGVAMLLSGCVTSFTALMATRLLLGGAAACATPAIASLVGDAFDPDRRGRVYGHVLSGELIGTGVGFLLAGELASWTWRAGFIALAGPAALLAWRLRRLPEPQRRGRHRSGQRSGEQRIDTLIRERHVRPRDALIRRERGQHGSIWWALRYVLAIPTNRVLIVASALAYFYFTGLRAFGVEYLHSWFDLSHGMAVLVLLFAGLGSLAGVIAAGHVADRLIARGYLSARVQVAAVAFVAAAAAFTLALLTHSLWLAMLLLGAAAAGLGGVSPPLDAARLDIMPADLWGRAESVRTFLRKCAEAAAPLTFGYVAEHAFGGGTRASGLHGTFLVMVIALAAGAAVAFAAIHTYPRDVATAAAERNA